MKHGHKQNKMEIDNRPSKIPKKDADYIEELSFNIGDEISKQLLELYNMCEKNYWIADKDKDTHLKNILENIMEGIKIIDTTYQIKERKLNE